MAKFAVVRVRGQRTPRLWVTELWVPPFFSTLGFFSRRDVQATPPARAVVAAAATKTGAVGAPPPGTQQTLTL